MAATTKIVATNAAFGVATIFVVANDSAGLPGTRALFVSNKLGVYADLGGGEWGAYSSTNLYSGIALEAEHRCLSTIFNSASNVEMWTDGSDYVQNTDGFSYPSRGGTAIGADPSGVQFHNGDIAEIIVYDAVLNETEREAVETYLMEKYAIGGTGFVPTDITGLKLWMPFNAPGSGTTWEDASSGGHDGTLVGGTAWTDGALAFTGSNCGVTIADSPDLNVSNACSFVCCLYINAYPPAWPYIANLLADEDLSVGMPSVTVEWRIDTQKLCFVTNDGFSYPAASSATSLPLGEWITVAGVWDGSTAKFYLNGELDSSQPFVDAPTNKNIPWAIGQTYDGQRTLNGYISELVFFTTAISDTDVANLHDYMMARELDGIPGTGGGEPVFTTNGTETGSGLAGLTDGNTSATAVIVKLNQWIRLDNDGAPIGSLKFYFNSTPDAATMKVFSSATGDFSGEETEVDSFNLSSSTMSATTRTTTFGGSDSFALLKMTSGVPFPPAQMNVCEIEITSAGGDYDDGEIPQGGSNTVQMTMGAGAPGMDEYYIYKSGGLVASNMLGVPTSGWNVTFDEGSMIATITAPGGATVGSDYQLSIFTFMSDYMASFSVVAP